MEDSLNMIPLVSGFLRCVTCPQSMVAISRKLRPCGWWFCGAPKVEEIPVEWPAAKDFTSCSCIYWPSLYYLFLGDQTNANIC